MVLLLSDKTFPLLKLIRLYVIFTMNIHSIKWILNYSRVSKTVWNLIRTVLCCPYPSLNCGKPWWENVKRWHLNDFSCHCWILRYSTRTVLLLCNSISEMYSGFCTHWKKIDSALLHDVLLWQRSSDTGFWMCSSWVSDHLSLTLPSGRYDTDCMPMTWSGIQNRSH